VQKQMKVCLTRGRKLTDPTDALGHGTNIYGMLTRILCDVCWLHPLPRNLNFPNQIIVAQNYINVVTIIYYDEDVDRILTALSRAQAENYHENLFPRETFIYNIPRDRYIAGSFFEQSSPTSVCSKKITRGRQPEGNFERQTQVLDCKKKILAIYICPEVYSEENRPKIFFSRSIISEIFPRENFRLIKL
jgi:hypothetical protein